MLKLTTQGDLTSHQRGGRNKLAEKSRPDEIASWITNQLRAKVWVEGDRMPSERKLCDQFSVSRVVVREALSKLKSEGLIISQKGRGVFVAPRGERRSFRLPEESDGQESTLSHVIELLVTIECAAARLAAIRRTEDDLKNIQRALIGMEYAIVNDRLGADEDFLFHQAISDATHNHLFSELNEFLESGVRSLIRQARSNTALRYADQIQTTQDEHREIYRAILAGDATSAAEAAEIHLCNAAKRLDVHHQQAAVDKGATDRE